MTTQRQLPPGHDDPTSNFWVAPEFRDDYQQVDISTWEHKDKLSRELSAAQHAANRARDLRAWEETRLHVERTDRPERYQAWLKQNSRADGSPNINRFNSLHTEFHDVAIPIEMQNLAEHKVALRVSIDQHQAKNFHRMQAAQQKADLTCAVCGVQRDDVKPRENLIRRCPECEQLIEFVRLLQPAVPGDRPRLEIVLEHLNVSDPAESTELGERSDSGLWRSLLARLR